MQYETQQQVKEDLKHILRGHRGSKQRLLQGAYNSQRQHALKEHPKQTKKETLKIVMDVLKISEYEARFDRVYFEWETT